jgi:hypothetical protein
MIEKAQNSRALPVTLSGSRLGSPESRAAARALSGPDGFPVVIREFVKARGPRDADGRPTGPPTCWSNTAEVDGKLFVRDANESQEDFKDRCIAAAPATRWGFVTMMGDAD